MANKLASMFYSIGRNSSKIGAIIHDAEILMSGDAEKIAKRAVRKTVTKQGNKVLRKINGKIK